MQTKQGIPVSPGIAISRAVVLDAADAPVPRRKVASERVEAELERLDAALEKSRADIESLRDQAARLLGEESARIFGFHLGMLHDSKLLEQFRQQVSEERVTAAYAVYAVMRDFARNFRQQESRYFRERVNDIWDLERRILGHLLGEVRQEIDRLDREAILVAHDLTPSQTIGLDPERIKAIVTEAGGRTSHTAILAHALEIPAIVGLEGVMSLVQTNDALIVDGNRGRVIIDPDADQLMGYRQSLAEQSEHETNLGEIATLPARTRDGVDVELMANIEFASEISGALRRGAAGIGLYRTEFLFLASESEPSEQEQYEAYREVIEALEGRPLTIRTVDLGADKLWPGAEAAQGEGSGPERNPFLGVRSIRLCLQNLPMFKTQLRAILRASAEGPVRIMFPLISSVMELRQAKMILADVQEDLEDQGVAYARDVPVGIMIEVPSAALEARTLAREADFFSIGTNDLIQYTVAVDRGNERVASLYSAAHPAVIRLIRDVTRAARRAGIPVSLCGEMGGEPEFLMLLIGLGLRSLSLTPPAIPEAKQVIRAVTIERCQKVARRITRLQSDREVLRYLRDELHEAAPEAHDAPGH